MGQGRFQQLKCDTAVNNQQLITTFTTLVPSWTVSRREERRWRNRFRTEQPSETTDNYWISLKKLLKNATNNNKKRCIQVFYVVLRWPKQKKNVKHNLYKMFCCWLRGFLNLATFFFNFWTLRLELNLGFINKYWYFGFRFDNLPLIEIGFSPSGGTP